MKKLLFLLLICVSFIQAQNYPFRANIYPFTTNVYDIGLNPLCWWDSLFVRYGMFSTINTTGKATVDSIVSNKGILTYGAIISTGNVRSWGSYWSGYNVVGMKGQLLLDHGIVSPGDYHAIVEPASLTGNRTFVLPDTAGRLLTGTDTILIGQRISGRVPYTGATNDVNLGTHTITGGNMHVISGTTSANGIRVGTATLTEGLTIWHNESNTQSYIDDLFDHAATAINFRTRVLGTPVYAMTILGSGNVGIGTTSPAGKLHVIGTTITSDTLRTGNWTTYSYIVPGGDLVKSSDSTLKENIHFCNINLNNFKNVSPRTFNFIGSTNIITGFLAQEFNSQLFGRTSTEISNSEITAALWEKVKQIDSTVQSQGSVPSGSIDSTIWMKKWREELYVPLTDFRLTDARTPLTHTHSESQVTNLVSDLASKEPTIIAGTTAQYWRGDKTWQTLPSGGGGLGYTIKVQALTSSPVDAQTVYFGMLPKAPVTTAATSKVYIRKAGTIKIAEIYCYSGTAGTNQAWSLYVRKNNTTDYLIATLSVATSERVFTNSSLSIAVVAGDYIEIKGIQPTWTTNPLTTIWGGYLYIE